MKIRHFRRLYSGVPILSAALILLLLCPAGAAAHGPQGIKLTYDASAQTLQAAITHSPFSASHYIERVEVKKNGKVATVENISDQSAGTFTYAVKIAAVPGDVLEVKATCSRVGSKTETLTVGPAKAR
mgnify:CR=1 FL=1